MLLNDLVVISEQGARLPIELWTAEELASMTKSLVKPLQNAVKKMDDKAEVKASTQACIKELESQNPNEYALAKALAAISKAFTSNVSSDEESLAKRYNVAMKRFQDRAMTAEAAAKNRRQIAESKTPEEILTHDVETYRGVGLFYCLEYYLAVYKKIIEQPTEEQQRWFIERPKIDIGTGDLPGVWKDLHDDEVLRNFIQKILDDNKRMKLTAAYYSLKDVVMSVSVDCDMNDECITSYHNVTVPQIIAALKQFITIQLQEFQKMGIEQLSSIAFTPYGNKPRLDAIKL